MKFSVIIPVYKVEKYIRKCIDSIINQTYKDVEIILVDDGSPDNCPKICDEYKNTDERIKVIHKENGGLSDARNVGVSFSTGEYIMFVDSDDYLEKNAIETLNSVILKTKADVVCFNLNNVTEDDYKNCNDGFPYCYDNTKKMMFLTYEEAMIDNICGKHIRYEATSKLYKRYIVEKIKFPLGLFAEDFDTFYQFLEIAKKIVYVDCNLYNYVQRNGSIMRSQNPKLYNDIFYIESKFYEKMVSVCQSRELKTLNETRSFKTLAKIYSKLYKTEYHSTSMKANKKIRELTSKNIKFKYRLMFYAFKLNDKLFAKLFNLLYKKA